MKTETKHIVTFADLQAWLETVPQDTLCDIPPSRLETGDFQVATFIEPGVKKTILQYSGERVETTMEKLIKQYQELYQQAGTGGEETNDQIALKNILTTLRNSTDLESARKR